MPPAVVLTVDAYKAFASLPDVKSAIGALLKSMQTVATSEQGMTSLRVAAETCVAALAKVALPNSLEKLVSKKKIGYKKKINKYKKREKK